MNRGFQTPEYRTPIRINPVDPRNDLAHARSNGGKLSRGGRSYDVTRFSELRSTLMTHHENLQSVVKRLIPLVVEQLNDELKKQG